MRDWRGPPGVYYRPGRNSSERRADSGWCSPLDLPRGAEKGEPRGLKNDVAKGGRWFVSVLAEAVWLTLSPSGPSSNA